MNYKQILVELEAIPNRRTKEHDAYNKQLIRAKADVSELKDYVLAYPLLHRTYFQVALGQIRDVAEQFTFIEANEDLLQDWWHVDQLTQFVRKPIDFDFALGKARGYTNSEKPFVRRWGYVLFLCGMQKDPANTAAILALMKNDDAYYVQMAEAWLICDLAVFNPVETIAFIERASLDYNILGKAVQKMLDSFRISETDKAYVKSLRPLLKRGGQEL